MRTSSRTCNAIACVSLILPAAQWARGQNVAVSYPIRMLYVLMNGVRDPALAGLL